MDTIIKLSPTHWLNLATVVEIVDEDNELTVFTTGTGETREGHLRPWLIHLEGEERTALLVWLSLLHEE